MKLNVENSQHAYFIGLAQSDGTLQEQDRNRGRFSIELKAEDEDLLNEVGSIFDCYSSITKRTRDTNFELNYESVILRLYDKSFRDEIKKYVPVGKKSSDISEPAGISLRDYYRGIIDGDGSLGITGQGIPFISLVTASESLARSYETFIEKVTGLKKHTNRNKRDNVFNIMVTKEGAQKLIAYLYYDKCLGLKRKKEAAKQALAWKRPASMRRKPDKIIWTPIQDEFLITHTPEECRQMFHHLPASRIWYRRQKLLKKAS